MAKVPIPHIDQNMGIMDRIVRGTIGGMLLMSFLDNRKDTGALGKLGGIVGGAFVVYGLTGWDPLLAAFHTSTQPEDDQNLFNRTKFLVKSKTNGKHQNGKHHESEMGV